MEAHHSMWTEPDPDNKFLGVIKMKWDSPENKAEYDRLIKAFNDE